MSPTMIWVLIIGVGLLVGGSLSFILATQGQHADERVRLSKHQRKLKEKQPLDEQVDIFAQQRDDYLSRILAQGGLESKYDAIRTQWIMISFGSGLGGFALAYMVSPMLGPVGFIFGIPAGAAGFIQYLKFQAKQRQDKITEQLPQALESMVSALRAGSPIMETFKVLSETTSDPIRSEFKRALVSLQLGKSFRDAIQEMSYRIKTPDFRLLTQAIFISQDVGANLADVVSTIAEAIRERFKLRDFMNSLTAQGKTTAAFIGALPYFITGMTYMMTPGYIIPFFNNPIARIIFVALVIWECIGFFILMKLTTFEV